MGLDAESSDLSERIRARAASEHPPVAVPVDRITRSATAPPAPAPVEAPKGPTEWQLRRAQFDRRRDELMTEGLSRDEAEEQADNELRQTRPAAEVVAEGEPRAGGRAVGGAQDKGTPATTPSRRRKTVAPEELEDVVRRLDLAESGIVRVSDRLSEAEARFAAYVRDFDAAMAENDAAMVLLAKKLVERTAAPSEPERPVAAPQRRYSFWRSRAGLFISAPARWAACGLRWLLKENGPFEYEEE